MSLYSIFNWKLMEEEKRILANLNPKTWKKTKEKEIATFLELPEN